MREGKWKLYHGRREGEEPALYNLSADIGEANNLAARNPETVKAMVTKLDAWETQLQEPLWGPGKNGASLK